MDYDATAEEIINDLASRKGFDAVWTDLDRDTRDIIRAKWSKIIREAEEEETSTPVESFLEQKYDHVLAIDKKDVKISQLSRLDDLSLDQRICVNRNLHNGQTKNIKIQAKIQDNGNLYIAGDYTQ